MPGQGTPFTVHLGARAMLANVQVCYARVTVAVVIVHLLGLFFCCVLIRVILMVVDELDIDHHILSLFGEGILCVPVFCFLRWENIVDFQVLILAIIVVNSVFILV